MALGATALVTLANTQTNLRIASGTDDTLLESIIEAVSDEVHTYLDRIIPSQSYTETQFVERGTIFLKQPDVSAVTMLGLDSEAGLEVKYSGSDTHARVDVTETAVRTISRVGATSTTTTTTFAAQVTTAAMATTINALSGWTATVKNSRPSAYLIQNGARNAKDITVTLEVWKDTTLNYEVDYKAGIIKLVEYPGFQDYGAGYPGHPQFGRAWIEYTAGYSSVPDDVEEWAYRMIARHYLQKGDDPALQSESLGEYSYSKMTDKDFEALWQGALWKYRRIKQ